MSKEAVNRIGNALRDGQLHPGTPAWQNYGRFLDFCEQVRDELATDVSDLVCDLPVLKEFEKEGRVVTTSRVKTTDTLRDKLRRMGNQRLIRIDDVVGIRVVADISLATQDLAADLISERFRGSVAVKDRRDIPVHGYRALHLVVRHSGLACEVQLRTWLQSRWAEVSERLADKWGRQIRYGQAPNADGSGYLGKRQKFIADWRRTSRLFAQYEDDVRRIDGMRYAFESRTPGEVDLLMADSLIAIHSPSETPGNDAVSARFLLSAQLETPLMIRPGQASRDFRRRYSVRQESALRRVLRGETRVETMWSTVERDNERIRRLILDRLLSASTDLEHL